MATNQTTRGYRYPDGTEPPALDVLLGNLAQDVNTDVQGIDDRLDTTESAIAGAAWIAPTLGGSPVWQPFSVNFRSPAYRKTVGNEVELRGAVRAGVGTIFTLPPGFRPEKTESFIVLTNVGAGDLRVEPSGAVYIAAYIAGGTNAVVSLNGVRFVADGS